jgi:osmotically-inducible protein OsmY
MTTVEERVKKDVVEELAWDNRVLATNVQVDVEGGVVTLSGNVSSHFSRQAAVDAAWRVKGVREVVDRLGVRYPEVPEVATDDRIRTNVESVLDWSPDIEVLDVSVAVTGGIVTLEGTVNAYWKKSFAESLVLGLSGVVRVENHLAIVPTEDVTDQAIAEDIVKAMERRWHLDPDRIDVTVENGLVTLSGMVPDIATEEVAFDAARYTAGVRGVRNDMTIAS